MARKLQAPAPEAERIQTIPQALAWIEAHLTQAYLKANGHGSAEAALKWFVASHEVEQLQETIVTLNPVELVISGLPPLSLANTAEDWARYAQEADADEPFDQRGALEDFFTDRQHGAQTTDEEEWATTKLRTVNVALTPQELVEVYEAVDHWREAQREALERGETEGADEEAELALLDGICAKLSAAETEQL